MRLIDAENLEKTLEAATIMIEKMASAIGAEDDEGIQMELKAYKDILSGIKEEETVEAIPVPWIEAFIAEHEDGLRADIMITRMIEYWRWEQNGN